jgi:hypothetical protein
MEEEIQKFIDEIKNIKRISPIRSYEDLEVF